MINFLLNRDEENKLLSEFKSLDSNKDGKLSREEIAAGYLKVHKKEINTE